MKREQTDPGMALAVEVAGSQSALGRLIGRRQSSISDRLRSGKPLWAESVLVVEAATGVSRHKLRPDLYPEGASTRRIEPRTGAVSCDRHALSQRASA